MASTDIQPNLFVHQDLTVSRRMTAVSVLPGGGIRLKITTAGGFAVDEMNATDRIKLARFLLTDVVSEEDGDIRLADFVTG